MQKGRILEAHQADERRNCQRIKFAEPVQYQFKDPNLFGGSLACDISESGIRMNMNEYVALNTELTLHVQLPKGKVIDCIGRVVWTRKLPFMDRYQAGLELSGTEAVFDSKKEIHQYIESQQV
jgi:hypothetical protein